MNDYLAPILLFVFKRPVQTRRTLEALSSNKLADKSVLYIYADGARSDTSNEDLNKINEVRQLIREKQWCKEVHIIEAKENKGLANSIIDGVSAKVKEFGKVIVLEDDLLVSRGFLQYMNSALIKYALEDQVMQVAGHLFPINLPPNRSSFFMKFIVSWGWATWRRAWDKFDPVASGYKELKRDKELPQRFDLNGSYPYSEMLFDQMERKTINSWAIRWWWTVFKNDGISLFPDQSLVKNIGYGEDASHTSGTDPFEEFELINDYFIESFPDDLRLGLKNRELVEKLLRENYLNRPGIIKRIFQRTKRLFEAFN